jgi:DNA-binding transcriptional LysR family regulator
MDQLNAMRAFVRVVETGSFTRAADRLDIPKPTITKQIQQLEAHLRAKLLNRTTRRVTVTMDGAAYYERVQRILAEVDELDGSMTLSQQVPSGRLRVDVSMPLALQVIIPSLPQFHARYPEIQIDLGLNDRPVDLAAENVDCVVRAGDIADQSLVARRVGEMYLITCATPGYLARHGTPRHPRDLENGHLMVGYRMGAASRPLPFTYSDGKQTLEVSARHVVSLNEGSGYVAAALAGLGVIQVPTFMVQDHMAAGRLVPFLTDWCSKPKPLHIVYPPNRHLSNKVRVFVDWVADLFAKDDLIQRRTGVPGIVDCALFPPASEGRPAPVPAGALIEAAASSP